MKDYYYTLKLRDTSTGQTYFIPIDPRSYEEINNMWNVTESVYEDPAIVRKTLTITILNRPTSNSKDNPN